MADRATSDHPAVQAQLDRLAALSPGRDILGLERISALLARLGDPHRALPPVFHVAGTNGKGSTCAFLRAAIEAAGLTAHVYTSPHLVRFNERIRVAGTLIGDDGLAALLAEILDAADGMEISFFEATTAAAFLAFARAPADAAIVEVGLGGRLDATNVIEKPSVCGIAALGIDHEAFLLAPEDAVPAAPAERIAFEKAGIAKPGVSLVVQRYSPSIRAEIAAQAAKAGAPLIGRSDLWDATADSSGLHYRDRLGALDLPLPGMAGAHQSDNAALAIAMLRHQTALAIPDRALAAAMERAHWPARLQRLRPGPLTSLLPEGTAFCLDGGHNAGAGAALGRALAGRPPLHLVCGMLGNKDAIGFLRPFADRIASFQAVPIRGHEHHDPEALCRRVREALGVAATRPCDDIVAALQYIGAHRPPGDVLIAGSLYLAGEALRENDQPPD